MSEERWEVIWDRVRSGRHTLVFGPSLAPPVPSDLKALRVGCDALLRTPGNNERLQTLLGEVDNRLTQAESIFGRLVLPGGAE